MGGVKATSKLLSSTYFKIKGNCSLKALKFKHLKYTGENTDTNSLVSGAHAGPFPAFQCCMFLKAGRSLAGGEARVMHRTLPFKNYA